jgi:SlyX protein
MQNTQDLENRLIALEIKASYNEDALDKFDQIITRQQAQIDQLVREIVRIRDQRPESSSAGQSSLQDELPPHY